METGKAKEGTPHENLFFFFVGEKINVSQAVLTGAQIKDAIRAAGKTFDPNHTLVLEGNGNEADRTIGDNDSIDVSHGHGHGGPLHFHSRPNADFGV